MPCPAASLGPRALSFPPQRRSLLAAPELSSSLPWHQGWLCSPSKGGQHRTGGGGSASPQRCRPLRHCPSQIYAHLGSPLASNVSKRPFCFSQEPLARLGSLRASAFLTQFPFVVLSAELFFPSAFQRAPSTPVPGVLPQFFLVNAPPASPFTGSPALLDPFLCQDFRLLDLLCLLP